MGTEKTLRTAAPFQSDKSEIGAKSDQVCHFLCCYILTFLQLYINSNKWLFLWDKECGCKKQQGMDLIQWF